MKTDVRVGRRFAILAGAEGEVGAIVITAVSNDQGGRIVARADMQLDPEKITTSPAVAGLRRLAEAADMLALAVMDLEETTLCEAGLSLDDSASEETLVLGRDFQGLYVSPELGHIAFTMIGDGLAKVT